MIDTTTVWEKSSFCSTGACIEVGRVANTVMLRDGKNPEQEPLIFTYEEWDGFQNAVLAVGKSF
ncbi:DUF397 domain-containing protein [Actinoplanes couchii]|uniref:DUF397 domain-containing protein n=1 Tax=Actinoplanes couchii TaxID=403638 RepID=A0ABQ3X105_9ACTN|nr:DUF397 domain-containing protein [Actinoplanes couchii]MDR6316534.1 hypothetical protein [Actinoplanes couchii]GID52148.1 hypothetical protein Aco03nite_005520 [Actinoplanes couchii]